MKTKFGNYKSTAYKPIFASLLMFGLVANSSCDAPEKADDKTSSKTTETTDKETGPDEAVDPDPVILDGIYLETVDKPTGKHRTGDVVTFKLNFTGEVTVTGVPQINFLAGPKTSSRDKKVAAIYKSGSGTKTLNFDYTVAGEDYSPFGFAIDGDSIELTNATMEGTETINLSLENFGILSQVKIIGGLDKSADGILSYFGDGAAPNCAAYKGDDRFDAASNSDGMYLVTNPTTGGGTMTAYCDMTTADGPWMLILNYSHMAGTAATTAAEGILPVMDPTTTLGTDLSADAEKWGHANKALVKAFAPTYMMWKCTTSNNTAEVLHLKTQEAECGAGAAAGSAGEADSCTGNLTDVTPLAENTSGVTLPTAPVVDGDGTAESLWGNLTTRPFAKDFGLADADAIWMVGDDASSWACGKDLAANTTNDTIHRVWMK